MAIYYSVCPHDCPDTCALKAETVIETKAEIESEIKAEIKAAPTVKIETGTEVKNKKIIYEKIVKVSGDSSHPITKGIICEKVRSYPERIYSPSRILYPMRRIGKKNGTKIELEAENKNFERISWEAAIDEIVKKWRGLTAKYGPECILPYSYGGTEGVINKGSMDRRLFNKIGATRLDRTICSAAGSLGYQLAYGASKSINPMETANSKLIIFWGINALETNMHQAILADNARKNGAKIIAIDVHRNKTAKWADDFYLILPGSDGALALGLSYVILRDNLEDKVFLEKHSYGFNEFYEQAMQYPPERVAVLTGLASKTIEELAHLYAKTKSSFISIGNGLQHHKNGGINTWIISLLPALTGAWQYKGGGALKSNSGYFPFNNEAIERPDLNKKYSETRILNMVQLGKILCGLNLPTPTPIRSLYVYNSNPAIVAPNQNLVLKGLAREDLFTVVHEQVMTDTAKWADIILPATTSFEHADLYASYWHTSIQWAEPVISPIGEAKPNIEVFKLLAKRLGYIEPCFLDCEEDIARQALDLPYWRDKGITLERLKKERFIMLNIPERPFADSNFSTASGKIEFKSKKLAELGLFDIPDYKPIKAEGKNDNDKEKVQKNENYISDNNIQNNDNRVKYNDNDNDTKKIVSTENLENKLNGGAGSDFPFTLITPPNHFFLNSTFANISSLKIKAKEPFLEINPADAKELEINDGDIVKIENERGCVLIKTKIIDSVLPGVVVSAGLWWKEDYKNQSGVNALTPDDLSDIGGGATFFSTSVKINKITA
ncbi:MAG: molybdopterin oxidoreductase family protein [bacterium]